MVQKYLVKIALQGQYFALFGLFFAIFLIRRIYDLF